MYRIYTKNIGMASGYIYKILLIMRLTTVLLIATMMQVSAASFAQKISLKEKNAPIEKIFNEIRLQSGYDFLFNRNLLKSAKRVDIHVQDASLEEALEACFAEQPFTYTLEEKTIIVKAKDPTFLERVVATLAHGDVRGCVVDAEGKPLPGATVKVKATGKGVSTDGKGNFYLKNVEEGTVLVISYTGYISKEVKAYKDMGDIALELSLSKLDEVQVIAYGTTTQRLSTGNVTTIKADVIEKQPVNNPLLALQGRVPGLFIEQATGFAGTGVKVRIQGQNSMSKGSDPLYVVDGVPFLSQLISTFDGYTPTIQGNSGDAGISSSPLNFINPSDIESIDILKDADATAIYGSRAANGAILITTKKGNSGEPKINFNLQTGIGQVGHQIKMLNTSQYLQMRHEALKNSGISAPRLIDYDLNGIWDTTRNINWQKRLIGGNAQYNDFQGSVSGGNNLSAFLIATGYHRETNVFPGNFADTKGSIHININSSSASQKIKIQFSGFYLTDNNKLPTTDLTSSAINLVPIAPEPYKEDGSLNWQPDKSGGTTYDNPLAPFKNNYNNKTNNLTGNASVGYRILEGLEIKSSFGFNSLKSDRKVLYPKSAGSPEDMIYAVPYTSFANSSAESWIIEPQMTFNRKSKKGQLNILLGATLQQSTNNSHAVYGSGYISDLLMNDLKAATYLLVTQSINSVYRYNALYGRFTYNWSDKYILNLTTRRDGSSNFGPENRVHNFAAIGTAWIFSQEKLIKSILPFLTQGKLRASYGTTGNDQIGSYQFLDLYESLPVGVPYQGGLGLRSSSLNNPYLKWEETRKLQIGFDLGFLNDKLLLNVNYNRNRSSNQLLSLALPIITGANGIAYNLPAIVQNTGWEFILNINGRRNDFNWSGSVNLTIPKNKLISFSHITGLNSSFRVNHPLTVQKVVRFAGVDENTGLYKFKNKDGVITSQPSNPEDRNALIDIDPKFYGGLLNNFTYKRFSIDILLQFVKQTGYDWTQSGTTGVQPGRFLLAGNNLPSSLLDRWQKIGDQANHQLFSVGSAAGISNFYLRGSDFMYTDASYIRLKNISISFILPETWKKKLCTKNITLFVQGQNLFTITKYKGLDPETKGTGLPPLRTITVGTRIIL